MYNSNALYEQIVSNFTPDQFPAFYKDMDTNFIVFMEAYYEWLEYESSPGGLNALSQINPYGNGPVGQARKLDQYRDVDFTIEAFLEFFQKKYLYGIPFSIIISKRYLLKHILDVYRSKTNINCYRLLFKLVYGDDVRIYLPGRDMLRVSDGIWYIPRYLEVNNKEINESYIGKTIRGASSGTTAIVEAYIREELIDNHSNIFYLSNISPPGGDFIIGEYIVAFDQDDTSTEIIEAAPVVLGSLDHITVKFGGQDFKKGYQFEIADRQLYRYVQKFGSISFELLYGGFGFTANATSYVYNDPFDSSGNGASFVVSAISGQTSVTYNNDLICDIAIPDLPISALQYNFPASPTSNLESEIGPCLSYANQVFGSISEISNTQSGRGYINAVTTFSRSTFTSKVLPGNVIYSSTNTAIYDLRLDVLGREYSNSDYVTFVNIYNGGVNAYANIVTDELGRVDEVILTSYGANFESPNTYIIFSNSSGGQSNGFGLVITPSFQSYVVGVNTVFESVFNSGEIVYLIANSHVDSVVVREVVNNEFMFLYGRPTVNSNIIFPDYCKYSVQPTIFTSSYANYEPLMYNTRGETHGKNEIIEGEFGRQFVNAYTHGTGGVVKSTDVGRNIGSIYFKIEYGGYGFTQNASTFTYRSIYDTTGNGASFDVDAISNLTNITYNTDLICDYIIPDLAINALQYNFANNPIANLSSQIGPCFSYANQVFGTILDLGNIEGGNGYTQPANTFTRSTFTSINFQGNISYSTTNTAVYALQTYGVTRNYNNSDIITIVNPQRTGSNAYASLVTDGSGSIIDTFVYNPGSNFSSKVISKNITVSNFSGGPSSGNGAAFTAINQHYISGNGTIFQSLFTNNEIIALQQDPFVRDTIESIVVREVVNNSFMFLYGAPKYNSLANSRYFVQPTIFTSSYANYEPLMYNTNNEIHGKNEIISADWKGDANSVTQTGLIDSGRGYWAGETVKAYLYGAIDDSVDVLFGGQNYQNNDTVYFSGSDFLEAAYGYVLTNSNGQIAQVYLYQEGAGYLTQPEPFVNSNTGSGAVLRCRLSPYNTRSSIIGDVILRGYGIGRGYWLNTQGQLDNNKYIQDSYYYQDYSYEIKVQKTLDQYRDIFYTTFHPAGNELFGQYLATISEDYKLRIVQESVEADTTPIGALFRWDSTLITADDVVITMDRVS